MPTIINVGGGKAGPKYVVVMEHLPSYWFATVYDLINNTSIAGGYNPGIGSQNYTIDNDLFTLSMSTGNYFRFTYKSNAVINKVVTYETIPTQITVTDGQTIDEAPTQWNRVIHVIK